MVTGVNNQTYLLAFLLSFSLSFIFCVIFFYRLRESEPVAPAAAPFPVARRAWNDPPLGVPSKKDNDSDLERDPPSYRSKDPLGPD